MARAAREYERAAHPVHPRTDGHPTCLTPMGRPGDRGTTGSTPRVLGDNPVDTTAPCRRRGERACSRPPASRSGRHRPGAARRAANLPVRPPPRDRPAPPRRPPSPTTAGSAPARPGRSAERSATGARPARRSLRFRMSPVQTCTCASARPRAGAGAPPSIQISNSAQVSPQLVRKSAVSAAYHRRPRQPASCQRG